MKPVTRTTVDLTEHPDLVVIYLGMRAHSMRGIMTLRMIAGEIDGAAAANPDGLLRHERFWFRLLPPHGGVRQYWRDFDALERWTRSFPHGDWWAKFTRDPHGTSFWHETYFLRGGFEAIYDNLSDPLGLTSFAPVLPARRAMFSARRRAGFPGEPAPPVIPETEFERL
jgi:Monooxygenase af470-like